MLVRSRRNAKRKEVVTDDPVEADHKQLRQLCVGNTDNEHKGSQKARQSNKLEARCLQ